MEAARYSPVKEAGSETTAVIVNLKAQMIINPEQNIMARCCLEVSSHLLQLCLNLSSGRCQDNPDLVCSVLLPALVQSQRQNYFDLLYASVQVCRQAR